MLKLVRNLTARLAKDAAIPAWIETLAAAGESGEDLERAVRAIVQRLGFDSFLCGWASAPRPDRDALLYVFTTVDPRWALIYDQEHYVEVDPRIQDVYDVTTLCLWSAEELRGRSPRRDRFFDDAERFGIRSGASFRWHDAEGNGVLIAYNSGLPRLRMDAVREVADTLYGFGHGFHEFIVRHVVEKDLPSRLRGAALTRRETEALQFVAKGLTLQDIGVKMGIRPRTVRFHVDSATTKLGAMKREEAVALAVKAGLIRVLR